MIQLAIRPWFFGGFLVVPWEVSEGSLVEVQEMNNVEIQGGWSAPQPATAFKRCWKHLDGTVKISILVI